MIPGKSNHSGLERIYHALLSNPPGLPFALSKLISLCKTWVYCFGGKRHQYHDRQRKIPRAHTVGGSQLKTVL